jgi:hypothetical protein
VGGFSNATLLVPKAPWAPTSAEFGMVNEWQVRQLAEIQFESDLNQTASDDKCERVSGPAHQWIKESGANNGAS